jgi:hypothetical protein
MKTKRKKEGTDLLGLGHESEVLVGRSSESVLALIW